MKNNQGFKLIVELSNGKKIELFYSSVKSSIDRITSFFKDKDDLISCLEKPSKLEKIDKRFYFDDTNKLSIRDIYIENNRNNNTEKLDILESKSKNIIYIYKNKDNLIRFIDFITLPKYIKKLKIYFGSIPNYYDNFLDNYYKKNQQAIIKNINDLLILIDNNYCLYSNNLEKLKFLLRLYLIDNTDENNFRCNYRNLSNLYLYFQKNNLLDYTNEEYDLSEVDFINYNLNNIFNVDQTFIFDSKGNAKIVGGINALDEPKKINRKGFPLKERRLLFSEKIDFEKLYLNEKLENLMDSNSELDDKMYMAYDYLNSIYKDEFDKEDYIRRKIYKFNSEE